MSQLSIRTADPGEIDTRKIFSALIPFYAEIGRAEMNMVKAISHISSIIEKGLAVIVENEQGEIVATMGLSAATYWYSDAAILTDSWLFVRKADRNTKALSMLLDVARDLAIQLGCDVNFTIAPPRSSRHPSGVEQQTAAVLGYTIGRQLVIRPPEFTNLEQPHVR